jgi:hypothetical protein
VLAKQVLADLVRGWLGGWLALQLLRDGIANEFGQSRVASIKPRP